ncbi:hypothetical protein UlMin_008239 [Ulmus minor]
MKIENKRYPICPMSPSFHLQSRLIHLLRRNATIFSSQGLLQIQAQLTTTGLLYSDPSSLISLLNLSLSNPATLHLATAIFSHTQASNAPTWPIMVRRLDLDADPFRVFSLFKAIQRARGNYPVCDPYVYASLIKACNKLLATQEGKSVHSYVLRLGLDYNVNVLNSLISFYSCELSLLNYACVLFDKMAERTVVTVNCMISGLVKNKSFDAGLGLFKQALVCSFGLNLKPNHVTLVILVSGCVEYGRFDVGKMLHCYCSKMGLCLVNEVSNALIDLYSKFECMEDASRMFDEIPERDLVSWNTMLAGYALVGNWGRTFFLFKEMRTRMIGFDRVSLISLILAAGSSRDLDMVKMVHGYIKASGTKITLPIGSALINMYSKCGSIEFARKVFVEVHDENIVSWNSMIHAYIECGRDHEALRLFSRIQSRKLKPDEVTMLGLILACRNSGELYHGIDIHSYIDSSSHLNQSIVLHNALIDMYAKCGNMVRAKSVFDKMPRKDVISWTSIIVGYAINGEGEEALVAFRRMEAEKVEPNSITFLGVLAACDHAGLVEEGKSLFDSMREFYNIEPRIEHCGCVVDMHARAGRLEDAYKFVKNMSVEPNAVIWRMLINACRVHGKFNLGLSLIGELPQPKTKRVAEDHVISSNFLAEAGRWDDVLNERSLMTTHRAMKVPGKSSISNLTE